MSYRAEVIQGYGFDPFALCSTPDDAARLALDIAAVAGEIAEREEFFGSELPLYAAAREHCRRIGGAPGLPGYLEVLRASDRP